MFIEVGCDFSFISPYGRTSFHVALLKELKNNFTNWLYKHVVPSGTENRRIENEYISSSAVFVA